MALAAATSESPVRPRPPHATMRCSTPADEANLPFSGLPRSARTNATPTIGIAGYPQKVDLPKKQAAKVTTPANGIANFHLRQRWDGGKVTSSTAHSGGSLQRDVRRDAPADDAFGDYDPHHAPGPDWQIGKLMSSRIFLSHSSKDNREAVALETGGWSIRIRRWPTTSSSTWTARGASARARDGRTSCRRPACAARSLLSACCRKNGRITPGGAESAHRRNLNKRSFARAWNHRPPMTFDPEWQRVGPLRRGAENRHHGRRPRRTGSRVLSTKVLLRLRRRDHQKGISAESFVWPPPNDPDRSHRARIGCPSKMNAGVKNGRDAQLLQGLEHTAGDAQNQKSSRCSWSSAPPVRASHGPARRRYCRS